MRNPSQYYTTQAQTKPSLTWIPNVCQTGPSQQIVVTMDNPAINIKEDH